MGFLYVENEYFSPSVHLSPSTTNPNPHNFN